jgi:hypothetical protein
VEVVTILPTVAIEVFTGLTAVGDAFLTLDDPVKGELDEALYPLFDPVGLPIAVDVSDQAFTYSVRRGRNDELDEISTGTFAAAVHNHNGVYQFDAPGFEPAKRVRLKLDDTIVYDGMIEDWEYEYHPAAGDCVSSFSAVDALGELATKTIPDTYSPVSQTAGPRISAVMALDEVGFPSARIVVDPGTSTLQADVIEAGQNALEYVNRVALSELGLFFASKTGLLTLQDRQTFTYTVDAAFADDGTGIPFSAITPTRSTEFLYNRVSITRAGGTEQIATTGATQGVRTLTRDNLLLASDADASSMADALLALYSEIAIRVTSLTVNLSGLTPEQRATCLALEIGNKVSIVWTPPGGVSYVLDEDGNFTYTEDGLPIYTETADPTTFAGYIEGIELTGDYADCHYMTLKLSPIEYIPFPFLLDNATEGVLDEDAVYY